MPVNITRPSNRFPFISLEKALMKAQQLFDGDKSGKPMAVGTAFQLWGYSPKSSGGFQTTGALKLYGLVEDEGANDDRKIKLSTEGRRYFLDERDDVRSAMLGSFALHPPLFYNLWDIDNWGDGIPADTVARSHLKLERGLNDQSARSVLSIFKENVQFAGLKAGVVRDEALDSTPNGAGDTMPPQEARVKPMHQQFVRNQDPPPPPADIPSVKLVGNERVVIAADVDLKGLRKLVKQLKLFETMLTMDDEDDLNDEEITDLNVGGKVSG